MNIYLLNTIVSHILNHLTRVYASKQINGNIVIIDTLGRETAMLRLGYESRTYTEQVIELNTGTSYSIGSIQLMTNIPFTEDDLNTLSDELFTIVNTGEDNFLADIEIDQHSAEDDLDSPDQPTR